VINLGNNAIVKGDVSTGPGGTKTGSGTYTGLITYDNNVILDPVIVPSIFSGPGGTLSIPHDATVTKGPGNYQYTNINFANKGHLDFTGSGTANLYLTANPAITSTGSNFQINVASTMKLNIYVDGAIAFTNN